MMSLERNLKYMNSDIKEIIIELVLLYHVSHMDPSILIIWTTPFFI